MSCLTYRLRSVSLGQMEKDAMRFHVVRDPQARPAGYRKLTRVADRDRTGTFGVLAVAACGLVITACASQVAPGAASSPTSSPTTSQTLSQTPSQTPSATSSPDTTKSPTSPSAAAAAGTGACATAHLKISLTNTGAVAGQAGGYLKFTNDSGTPCRMSGWPAVTGLTAAGQATRLRHLQSSMFGAWQYTPPPPVVTLQPGGSAYAIVAADDKPTGSSSRCPAPYARLRVSAPGDSGNVTVSAWLPGATSYLPSCTSANGSPTAGTSTITTLSSLPH